VSLLKNGKEKFQQTMSAAAFAEAGEFETARQIAGKKKNSHKKVLVVLENEDLNMRILNYAQDLCARLGGQLEILHKQGPDRLAVCQSSVWQDFTKKAGGVVCTSLAPDESLDEMLIEYGRTRRDILCVVLRIDLMDKKPIKKKVEKAWSPDWIMQKLNCPVMVYS
jgi:putative hemolysin